MTLPFLGMKKGGTKQENVGNILVLQIVSTAVKFIACIFSFMREKES